MYVMGIQYDSDDMDDEDEELEEEVTPPRRSPPRFGPFVTITAAILMLFGAASQVGKTTVTDAGLGLIDSAAAKNLERDRQQREDDIAATLIAIGTKPGTENNVKPPQRTMNIDDSPLPPARTVDNSERGHTRPSNVLRPPPLSGINGERSVGGAPRRFDPVPEATQQPRQQQQPQGRIYVVTSEDSWNRIEKKMGKPWKVIQKANPESRSGLRAGMRLVIP